jgi:hypothetical protein
VGWHLLLKFSRLAIVELVFLHTDEFNDGLDNALRRPDVRKYVACASASCRGLLQLSDCWERGRGRGFCAEWQRVLKGKRVSDFHSLPSLQIARGILAAFIHVVMVEQSDRLPDADVQTLNMLTRAAPEQRTKRRYFGAKDQINALEVAISGSRG